MILIPPLHLQLALAALKVPAQARRGLNVRRTATTWTDAV